MLLSATCIPSSAIEISKSTKSISTPNHNFSAYKCETFAEGSSCSESMISQSIIEVNEKNPIRNDINSTSSNGVMLEENVRDCDNKSAPVLRQTLNNNINSCPPISNATSPINGSDQSNSSNISSSLSQGVDGSAVDLLQELNSANGVKKKLNSNINIKEEENGQTCSTDKSSYSANLSKTSTCHTPVQSSVKDDTDMTNIKKEDSSVSPTMSPVEFGSIILLNSVDGNGRSNNSGNKGGNEIVSLGNNASGLIGVDDTVSGSGLNSGSGSNGQCTSSNPQHLTENSINNNSHIVVPNNCLDYMQQQNHIFVFSTQLANKGAESVIDGQFPTIIAYHCSQPATKSFLEEFFIKNPMKMSKIQRQNALNYCNTPLGNGQSWFSGGVNATSKIQQKYNGGKISFSSHFNSCSVENKLHVPSKIRPHNLPAYSNSSESLPGDNALIGWDQGNRNSSESSVNDSENTIKMIDSTDTTVSSQNCNSKLIVTMDTPNDMNIPSLQGVKVPDENLTPQQRQHREEQLAKLKKMNQFLFPENESAILQETSQVIKQNSEGADCIMVNLPGKNTKLSTQSTSSANNSTSRNIANVLQQNSINPTLSEDQLSASDLIDAHEIAGLQCNSNGSSKTQSPNIPCGGSVGTLNSSNVGNVGNSVQRHNSTNVPNSLVLNTTESAGCFNQTTGPDNSVVGTTFCKNTVNNGISLHETNHIGMPSVEWSKLQNQFFEERMKEKKSTTPDMTTMSPSICRLNTGITSNLRSGITNNCTSTVALVNTSSRSSQGPPPPYHSTQRCASVPIATIQSPNPGSPNNPTSNLSLPSPHNSGTNCIPINFSSVDALSSTMPSLTTSTTLTMSSAKSSICTTSSNSSNLQNKSNFQMDLSPSNNCSSVSNTSKGRNNLNQFIGGSSLSHMSPKDLDPFHLANGSGELKSSRTNLLRSRSPLLNSNNNSSIDLPNVEGHFPTSSPGLNFPPHPSGSLNIFKTCSMERQSTTPIPQFCRRTDNLPLNPNSTRSSQTKLSHTFDPISSLAQMSQQLTSCVLLNSGNNNSSGMRSIGVANDINVSTNQNIDGGIMPSLETVDQCNPATSNNMNMLSLTGSFNSNNCHINSMIAGQMGQRLMNPKICAGGFNPVNGGMRENPGSFHSAMQPSHRMISRIGMNFGGFNVSSNIQVKASTPNTIQYLPVRAHNNSNNNMRVPPSLEFLQRYANPHSIENGNVVQGNTGNSADSNKLPNSSNLIVGNSGMNFFQTCHQAGSPIGCVDQEDISSNLLSTHDLNMGVHSTSMIRNLRPMRQISMSHSSINPTLAGPRIQAPGSNMMGSGMHQFANVPHNLIECNDTVSMFNSESSTAISSQLFPGGQHKSGKPMNNHQNLNAGNTNSSNIIQNDHNLSLHSPVNGPVMISSNNNNVIAVGPSPSDLEYAQQFHSFQQQLYATSTRSQQNGGTNAGTNNNSNFFSNK